MEIDYEISRDLATTFLISCPRCEFVHRNQACDLHPGTEIHCLCGAILEVNDSGFSDVQRELWQLQLESSYQIERSQDELL